MGSVCPPRIYPPRQLSVITYIRQRNGRTFRSNTSPTRGRVHIYVEFKSSYARTGRRAAWDVWVHHKHYSSRVAGIQAYKKWKVGRRYGSDSSTLIITAINLRIQLASSWRTLQVRLHGLSQKHNLFMTFPAMLVLYVVQPLLYRLASSTYYNLSLLSSNFYGLLFGE